MILNWLKLKNIRSYLEQELTFPEGTILLNGDIGTGKTTILLAVEFALFSSMAVAGFSVPLIVMIPSV